ncbi:unnamed protein product [Brassica rapa subsp. narinosa]
MSPHCPRAVPVPETQLVREKSMICRPLCGVSLLSKM